VVPRRGFNPTDARAGTRSHIAYSSIPELAQRVPIASSLTRASRFDNARQAYDLFRSIRVEREVSAKQLGQARHTRKRSMHAA
jgi:hypothetical protein